MDFKIVYQTDTGGGLNEDEFYEFIKFRMSDKIDPSGLECFDTDYWGDQLLDCKVLNKFKKRYANK